MLFKLTAALGTTAPVGSLMTPLMSPVVVVWAQVCEVITLTNNIRVRYRKGFNLLKLIAFSF
jgi:hypothetical protein